MIDRLLSIATRISTWLVWFGGALLIGAALLVTVEVFSRKFFNVSMAGADELSGYAFGVATTLAMAYALFHRAHIRVDAAYGFFPLWLRRAADLIGHLLLLGLVVVIAMTAWGLVADTIEYGSRSITPMRTPLIIPQLPWLAGWIFFIVCLVLVIVAAIFKLATGRGAEADRLIGVPSVQEQIDEERES
ncbi:MAG: TRAP transporter small permease [Burkholderiaceae bacterium]